MALLGDDGRGYELARKLESCGVWRSWLGDSLYANFVHSLSSSSAWEAFLRADDSKSRAQIQLQLRARALLFDKAAISLFLRVNPISPLSLSNSVSKLNPSYLQLHGDDVYFTLEDGVQQRDGVTSNTAPPKIQSKGAMGVGSRHSEIEIDSVSQRLRQEDFPDTWYNQFIEKYRSSIPYKSSSADRDSDMRTPSEMSNFVKLLEGHKRRRITFKDDHYASFGNPIMERLNMQPSSALDGDNLSDDSTHFFPETMFMMNCVPDSAIAPRSAGEEKQKAEFFGVLDMLPQLTTKSSIMIERLGIRPEYLSMEQGPGQCRTRVGSDRKRKLPSQEQAVEMSKKVIARLLTNLGFDGATETAMEVLSQFLSCHICKLGRMLKVLADSYRKQCSAIELIRIFLHTAGYGNLGALAELVKDGRNSAQQNPQQVQAIQSQLLLSHQNPLQLPQQISRQMHPQMQQVVHPQNLAFQQQQMLERMRRRQTPSPRPASSLDKERPLAEVKIENPSDPPLDGNASSTINGRHPQLQFRQHINAALQKIQAQSGGQFRQLTSFQIPQTPTQSVGIARAPPVKVEGFQELMGGDTPLKHDSDESKLTSLTSPSK
ncbi:hypothetical protein Nepgr_026507 [Nepenthes gracilis]|uniref:Bromodomain associated domain-containing protein n=1 Tax=Nepenthes gracilis TaxID=150966 RepID=A0AAD3T951_NEPGR|nr:hypothetical protein Nepgr_026507 [Nepenthes gracilis]